MTESEIKLLEEVVGKLGQDDPDDEDYPERVQVLLSIVRRERLDALHPGWEKEYEQADFLQKEYRYKKLALLCKFGGAQFVDLKLGQRIAAKNYEKLRELYSDFDSVWKTAS